MKYILLAVLLVAAFPSIAQKIGHVNYGNLLESLPAVTNADKKLTAYQDSLGAALETRVKAHRERIQENQEKFQAGKLTRIEADAINNSLNEEQAKLIDDQKRAEATIMIRKQGSLQPIILHVNEVIAKYGKENGYLFIFDESSGFLLFDQPTDDLTDEIRKLMTE